MKAAQHRAFRELLLEIVVTALNEKTAAQGVAAWRALMKTCELPRTRQELSTDVIDRYADWFSERVDEEAAAEGLRCDIVVYQHFAKAGLAMVTPIVIAP